jgi:hypothetical protein
MKEQKVQNKQDLKEQVVEVSDVHFQHCDAEVGKFDRQMD